MKHKSMESSADIEDVLRDLHQKELDISKNSSGPMDTREAGLPDGETTSCDDELWDQAKSYETIRKPILFSLAAILVLLGVGLGSFFEQRSGHVIVMDHKEYNMVGLAVLNADKDPVYVPVYKEKK